MKSQQIPNKMTQNDKLLRPSEVCKKLGGISKSTLWRMEKRGELPKKRRISPGVVGFLESEINALISGDNQRRIGEEI